MMLFYCFVFVYIFVYTYQLKYRRLKSLVCHFVTLRLLPSQRLQIHLIQVYLIKIYLIQIYLIQIGHFEYKIHRFEYNIQHF